MCKENAKQVEEIIKVSPFSGLIINNEEYWQYLKTEYDSISTKNKKRGNPFDRWMDWCYNLPTPLDGIFFVGTCFAIPILPFFIVSLFL